MTEGLVNGLARSVKHCAVIVEDKRTEVTTANIYEVAVDVREQGCFLGDKDGLLALTCGPADECRHLTAFAHAGLVTDNKGLPLLHLVDCHSNGIHLLCSKGVMHGLNGIISEFIGYEIVNGHAILGLNLADGGIHRLNHSGGRDGFKAECR